MASNKVLSPDCIENWTFTSIYQLGGIKTTAILSEMETSYLCQSYNYMYPDNNYHSSSISSAIHKYSHIKVGNNMLYGSKGTRIYILAGWCSEGGVIETSSLRPAQIKHFFQHFISVGGSFKFHLFAVVEWFKPHPSKNGLGESTVRTIWYCILLACAEN